MACPFVPFNNQQAGRQAGKEPESPLHLPACPHASSLAGSTPYVPAMRGCCAWCLPAGSASAALPSQALPAATSPVRQAGRAASGPAQATWWAAVTLEEEEGKKGKRRLGWKEVVLKERTTALCLALWPPCLAHKQLQQSSR